MSRFLLDLLERVSSKLSCGTVHIRSILLFKARVVAICDVFVRARVGKPSRNTWSRLRHGGHGFVVVLLGTAVIVELLDGGCELAFVLGIAD